MIIYGSRSSHVKTVQLQNESCPHCNTQNSMVVSTYARYAHVFWIPIFSLGRTSLSECKHCKQVLELKQMPPQIRAYHERNVTETRVPVWQFTGLVLILVGISVGVYSDHLDREQQAQFLESPVNGDVYEYKTEGGSYTLFKIAGIDGDTITVKFNDYEVKNLSGLYTIDKDENYSDTTYYLSRARLTEMFAAGNIADINRTK